MTTTLGESARVDEQDLATRVAALSLRQKIGLLTGGDLWSLQAEPAAGLRRIVVSDGPAGVRGEHWDERDPSANVPCPTAIAASWDEELSGAVGRLLAAEARRKGVDVLLAPTLNLHRTPYGGRHFECYSEDPLLTARIGVALIAGVQAGGVAATAKHFIGNETETDRHTVDVLIDERTLHEVYLAPFEAAVCAGGAWSVMASYNRVNGTSMTESDLLAAILHDELGFDGMVMSDWFATGSTVASALAGLDLVMPGPDGPWGTALAAAVADGRVPQAAIDDKVRRVLRLAARVGALDGTEAAPAPVLAEREVAGTLRRAAAAGFVLLENRDATLPLDRAALTRVAVIGPNGASARMGGGSATVFPPYRISPLDGLRSALDGQAIVEHAPGGLITSRLPVAGAPWIRTAEGAPGAEVRFLSADGEVLAREHRLACAFNWPRSLDHGGALAWVEVRTVVRATEGGVYTVGGSGVGHYRLRIGGTVVFDGALQLDPGTDKIVALILPPQMRHPVELAAGEEVEVVLSHEVGSAASELGDIGLAFQLNLRPPHGTEAEELERAQELARRSDAAVVVVGTTEEVESEGFDRSDLRLPGGQDELVRRVAAANPRTIVVVNAGAPVLLPWAAEVPAVLVAWFPGQEFGRALAEVVLGETEPGGRLPMSWPLSEAGLPPARPVDGRLPYDDGLALGYRAGNASPRRIRYPFGHGLGYSTWEYRSLQVPEVVRGGEPLELGVVVRNAGPRASRETVQVYASRPDSRLDRPERWLVAFGHVEAEPGAEVTATLTVAARSLEHWDPSAGSWALEPGEVEIWAGPSSGRLELHATTRIPAGSGGGGARSGDVTP